MKQKIPLEQAEAMAEKLVDELRPFCERIAVAGSIRRRKPEVGDIEIVAVPKPWKDMLGESLSLSTDHALNHVDWTLKGKVIKNGSKMKQVELYADVPVSLDLFIVTPPATWGVIFLIRTGPEEYGHKIVTLRRSGGLCPSNLKFKDGALWHGLTKLETPEERDVFKFLGLPWTAPENRTA